MTQVDIEAALGPIRQALVADGYELLVKDRDDGLRLSVTAGPDACEDCLIPKAIFLQMVESTLEEEGIAVGEAPIAVDYPNDPEHA